MESNHWIHALRAAIPMDLPAANPFLSSYEYIPDGRFIGDSPQSGNALASFSKPMPAGSFAIVESDV
jgi:hypothetical protein